MNTKALVLAVTAACLTSGAAFAQSYDYRNDRNDRYERDTQYQRGTQEGRYDRDGDGRADRDDRRDRERSYYGRDSFSHDSYSRQRNDYIPARIYGDSSQRYNNSYNHNSYGNERYVNASRYQMRHGEYLSNQYRDRRYVVSDWRSRNLYQPQYGYQWVQAGNDYAMVAIATGLIAAVMLNH